MTWWGILIIVVLIITTLICLFAAIKFGTIILRIQDVVEESLDVLDERYASIDSVMRTPLFYDSPEVRKVLKDIQVTRSAILDIAKALTTIDIEKEEPADLNQ